MGKKEEFSLLVPIDEHAAAGINSQAEKILACALELSNKLPFLTNREREVMALVCERISNKEIASRLEISTRTVKFHISALLEKYDVTTREDLARRHLGGSDVGNNHRARNTSK